MFESSDISGELVYCRDKWEYRGDYSYATRFCITVDPDPDKWKFEMVDGFEEYDM